MTGVLAGADDFFRWNATNTQPMSCTIAADGPSRWRRYWSIVRPHAGSILALYPLDEPPHCWPPTGAKSCYNT